ncbi:MAG: magnesium transporter CorA family protein [Candidatus Levybacteria bacterium]|nr:magnesium transporter CorA family protein [Candidatus Levybacteria bacterium]MBI2190235.1 magnesium transporter CorA family protein [Candidatus Levybacteria bacterium]MBI2622791.1 magnesium transporter CorA family protein [Candidatus Levybacteria bacterium]MBI3069802.1 magnesium transporter CorA family protein [Candidatus Levybacteria bacterium]MBI3092918.1 magnesium transporter CorA family protein [Candidatus Levybacteria bacterium]
MNIQTVNFKDLSFINVTNPGDLELKYLRKNFDFDTLHLEDYLHKTQVPKIETFKNYSLIVLDLPYINPGTSQNGSESQEIGSQKSSIRRILDLPQATLSSVPLPAFPQLEKKRRILSAQMDLFVGKNYVVVLHDGTLAPINDIFARCQKTLRNREEFMSEGPVFLAYRIIDALVDACFPLINELSTIIDRVDKDLETKPSDKTLEDISTTRRNIVVFRTTVKTIIPLFRQLEEGKHNQLNGRMQSFWGNILDHAQKVWERLEDSQELIEGISESNESYLTSKTNEIIKVLTIFSAIILPLNLLASIYGMNIKGLPFAEETSSLELIIFTMILTSILMFVVFKIRRWF